VRRELHHQLALKQRLADQAEVEVLQVSKPAVDHLRGAAGGTGGIVSAFHERHRVAPAGGVERRPGPGDAAADDDDVESLGGEGFEGVLAGEH
jgi:hypothetical protein